MRKECIERERYPPARGFSDGERLSGGGRPEFRRFCFRPENFRGGAENILHLSGGAAAVSVEGVKISAPETDTGHCPPCVKVNEKEPIFSQICLIFPYFYDILMCKVKNCALQRISIQKK